MPDTPDTREGRVKQQVDDFLDEALGPADPVTDKSDTRGLVEQFATERALSLLVHASRVSPHLREALATVEDAHRAALSCVRRLLDGLEQACADSFADPVSAATSYIEHAGPLSPSEVHIIEMVSHRAERRVALDEG